MSNMQRVMWNGTVRALPLDEQLKAAAIAGCETLTVTPSDYNKWLGSSITTRDIKTMSRDAGVAIVHLDPLVRWVEDWKPDLPPESFPADIIGFDQDDFFRMAAALEMSSFTVWGGFPQGRYSMHQMIDAFRPLALHAGRPGF